MFSCVESGRSTVSQLPTAPNFLSSIYDGGRRSAAIKLKTTLFKADNVLNKK